MAGQRAAGDPAGVGLAGRGLFAEGLTGQNAVLAQTGRRWTGWNCHRLGSSPSTAGVTGRGLLKATERQLVLARARPGMLTALAEYLFERTSGHIGSFITLITRGCVMAIRSREEELTAGLLEQVRIDEASEQARRQLAAAFAAGRLSTAPARRGSAAERRLMSAPTRTLPLRVRPALGEALDSWLEPLARRHQVTVGMLVTALGWNMPPSPGGLVAGIPAQVLSRLEHQAGLPAGRLDDAVLDRYLNARAGETARVPVLPVVLAKRNGRLLLAWRLGWTLACTAHGVLLCQTCLACG